MTLYQLRNFYVTGYYTAIQRIFKGSFYIDPNSLLILPFYWFNVVTFCFKATGDVEVRTLRTEGNDNLLLLIHLHIICL